MLDKDDVIQVKEAFKWIIQGLVAKELPGVAVVGKVGRIKTLKAQPVDIKLSVKINVKLNLHTC